MNRKLKLEGNGQTGGELQVRYELVAQNDKKILFPFDPLFLKSSF